MKCKLTIAIPFFNAERTLADAIRSVFAQTYSEWELLLVDDGSSDGSLKIARSVRDPRVTVIADGVNRGLPTRLNQIAHLADSEYLARMDADDLMHPNRLEKQVAFLDANPGIDLVGTLVYSIDQDNKAQGIRRQDHIRFNLPAVVKWGLLVHPTVTGRANWFRNNPYDPLYVRAEDYELWCRVVTSAKIALIQEPLLFYRETVPINLRNYLRSSKTSRMIIRKYGPFALGHFRTALLVARSYLKTLAYRVYTLLGLQERLVRKRNQPMTPGEMATFRSVIAQVVATEVPGLCMDLASPQQHECCSL
jgi:glycosyltransferase involved in cell wall biosynthesis